MIYVSQGSFESIGIEVFLKSFILIPIKYHQLFKVFISKSYIETYPFQKINVEISKSSNFKDYLIIQKQFEIEISFLENSKNGPETLKSNTSYCLLAILEILKIITPNDILLTLPANKSDFFWNNKVLSGHTHFFRDYFNNENITMFFRSGLQRNIFLLTDHIPLKKVPEILTNEFIEKKLLLAIENFQKHFNLINSIYIAGINPHAGENSQIGTEDQNILKAIQNIKLVYPKIKVFGPLPADTLNTIPLSRHKNSLRVYCYHDQGLIPFKDYNGFIGANISLGMNFLRLSVDHGTAKELIGKNKANISGCYFTLMLALDLHKKQNQKL
jgi:4-hydroxythreonine-4-phosphate dehydrogenase